MLKPLYLLQQTFDVQEAIRYSVGLTLVCLTLLLLLWLPDVLRKD